MSTLIICERIDRQQDACQCHSIRNVVLFVSLSRLRIPSSHFVKGGLCYSGLILLDPWLFGDVTREKTRTLSRCPCLNHRRGLSSRRAVHRCNVLFIASSHADLSPHVEEATPCGGGWGSKN